MVHVSSGEPSTCGFASYLKHYLVTEVLGGFGWIWRLMKLWARPSQDQQLPDPPGVTSRMDPDGSLQEFHDGVVVIVRRACTNEI